MFKEVLRAIPNIETYPVIALFVFLSFFVGLMIWFFRVDKRRMDAIAEQALVDDIQAPSNHSTSQGV
ncbi:MAG: hypothetical protein J5I53_02615 [Bradyrhizobiaceae bacterium]|nr:hypothetical protein [Bradyrhizobiaceae bacterium]